MAEAAYLARASRGKNHWARHLFAGLLAFVLAIVVLVAGTVVLLLLGAPLRDLSPARPAWFFGYIGFVFASYLAAFWLAVRAVQHKRFTDIAGSLSVSAFGRGATAWGVVLVLVACADAILAPGSMKFTVGPGTSVLAVAALLTLPVQTLAEEWIFRGWLTQGLLLATRRGWAAALISGLAFGALHLPNGVYQAAQVTVFGICASVIAIRYGGIAFTFGMHLVNNVFSAIVLVSAHDAFGGAPALFTVEAQETWWGVGVWTVLFALFTWLVCRYPRWPQEVRG